MKKLLLWLGLVVVASVILDVIFGACFNRYMRSVTLPGDYEMTDHVLRSFDEDIVVLGSSVALNSIDTRTLEDSIGVKTFNGGANGQAFPFYLTMLKAVVGQKTPRRVVLGLIAPNLVDSGAGIRYNFLAPYYGSGIADIDSVMTSGSTTERIFLNSNFYRLNRIWFRILLYNFVSAGIKGENGFVAKPVPSVYPERIESADTLPMSASRRAEFEEFVDICSRNGIELTVVFTPRCAYPYRQVPPAIAEAREICRSRGFELYDDTSLPGFDSDTTLFYDANHINIRGTKIYTDTIIGRIKRYGQIM